MAGVKYGVSFFIASNRIQRVFFTAHKSTNSLKDSTVGVCVNSLNTYYYHTTL